MAYLVVTPEEIIRLADGRLPEIIRNLRADGPDFRFDFKHSKLKAAFRLKYAGFRDGLVHFTLQPDSDFQLLNPLTGAAVSLFANLVSAQLPAGVRLENTNLTVDPAQFLPAPFQLNGLAWQDNCYHAEVSVSL
jgi:hypothetical protein